MLNAVCISDLQIPFEHPDAFDFIFRVRRDFFRKVHVDMINMGDEVDQHTLSKWAKNPNGMSGGDEFKLAKERLRRWYCEYPNTKVCISNHTYRVAKRAYEAGIPEGFMKTIGEAYEAPPGWQWRDKWVIDGICFEHGEAVSGPLAAIRAATMNHMPTVIGHQHANGGVIYQASEFSTLWGMNTGCLIDTKQYAFDYGKNIRNKPTLGCGVICNGIPYFVPMLCDAEGKWLGRF
jgi:hypothetical protein